MENRLLSKENSCIQLHSNHHVLFMSIVFWMFQKLKTEVDQVWVLIQIGSYSAELGGNLSTDW